MPYKQLPGKYPSSPVFPLVRGCRGGLEDSSVEINFALADFFGPEFGPGLMY